MTQKLSGQIASASSIFGNYHSTHHNAREYCDICLQQRAMIAEISSLENVLQGGPESLVQSVDNSTSRDPGQRCLSEEQKYQQPSSVRSFSLGDYIRSQ